MLDETMGSPREGLDGVVITVPSGEADVDDKTFIFVLGGRSNAVGDGYFVTGEKTEVLEDGTLVGFEPLPNDLNQARAFFPMLTNQGQHESGFDPDPPEVEDPDGPIIGKSIDDTPYYLIAVMGDDSHDGTNNTGTTTFEVCEIANADGDNGPWYLQDETSTGQGSLGHEAALYFDFMFIFAGVAREDLGDNPDAATSPASRFEFSEIAPLDMNNVLHDHQSVGQGSFVTGRSYYGAVRLNGYNIMVGGNDGDGPVASIEKVLQ
jgi:hypothetical protein